MRISRVCQALALAVGLLPGAARAGEIFYFCHDDTGVPENLKVDIANKRVTMISGRSPTRCVMEFENGAFTPAYMSAPGEICVLAGLSQGERARKFVSASGNVVTFGATAEGGTQKFTLDMANGVLDYAGGADECHRARG